MRKVFKRLEEDLGVPITDELYRDLMKIYTEFRVNDDIKTHSVEMNVKYLAECHRLEKENVQLKKILNSLKKINPELMEFYED